MLRNRRRVAKQHGTVRCACVRIDRSASIKMPSHRLSMMVQHIITSEEGSRCWLRLVVSHMKSVLSQFSCSRLTCIQSATARTHSLMSDRNELSQKAGGSRVFGCRQHVDVPTDRSAMKSTVYIINRMGPSTGPCYTANCHMFKTQT